MATFVLVHGAWHGGWCWERVAPLLREAGHTVYTPTLAGLAERAHELTEETNLDTHIQDIVGLLEGEELSDVILVGHSYAGVVITGVADCVPERLARLVYLDAFVPGDEVQASGDGKPPPGFLPPEGLRVPPPPLEVWGITAEDDRRYLRECLTPHPLKTFEQPLRLNGPSGAGVPRTYIACTAKAAPDAFTAAAARVRDDPAWCYRELPTGHEAMITMPRETAALLIEVATTTVGEE